MKKINDFLFELFSLEGYVGIVTGASSGIGLGIANCLSAAGAKIFNFSRRGSVAGLNETVESVKIDISNRDAVKQIVAEIGEKNGIDFLINNAGITKRKKAEEVDEQTWRSIQNINSDSLYFMSQVCFPYLKESLKIGRIINIASMASHFGFTEVVPYTASKAAVLGITRGLAVEWSVYPILVNAVTPGWFPSEMNLQVMDEERKQKIMAKIPLRKFGMVEDLGAMVLFLVSNAATYITGQEFVVDGGAMSYGY